MNGKRFTDISNHLNEAQQAAADVAGTLELLAILYGTLAAKLPVGSDESTLAATFSTLQTRAATVSRLLDETLE